MKPPTGSLTGYGKVGMIQSRSPWRNQDVPLEARHLWGHAGGPLVAGAYGRKANRKATGRECRGQRNPTGSGIE